MSSICDIDDYMLLVNAESYTSTAAQIETTSLDCWVALNSVSAVHGAKVDVQGWELPVLLGGSQFISDGNSPFLVIEHQVAAGYQSFSPYGETSKLLHALNMRLINFFHVTHTSQGILYFFDALYVHLKAAKKLNLRVM